MTTNQKIVKQGFKMHGFSFSMVEGRQCLDIYEAITLEKLTEVCRTISLVVGFGLPGNDADDNS